MMACFVTVQPGGLSQPAAGIHSWNSLCTLHPAVQQLTISKDEVGLAFHHLFIKGRKSSAVAALSIRSHLLLAKPCKKHWPYCGSN